MRTRTRHRQLVACVLLTAYFAGCTTWRTQQASPQQFIEEKEPSRVRVTLLDGSTREYFSPWVHADSIRGYRSYQPQSADTASAAQVEPTAVEDVAKIKARGVSGGRTAVLGVSIVLVAGLVAVVVAAATWDGPFATCSG